MGKKLEIRLILIGTEPSSATEYKMFQRMYEESVAGQLPLGFNDGTLANLSRYNSKMLSQRIAVSVPKLLKRNFGVAAPVLQKASDPIQQLFLDKIKEYKTKSSGGKLEKSPEIQKELKGEYDKLAKQYGGGEGVDMTAFPKFSFPEPKVEVSSTQSSK